MRCTSHHDCVKPEDHIPLLVPSASKGEGFDEVDPENSGGASGSGGIAPTAPQNELSSGSIPWEGDTNLTNLATGHGLGHPVRPTSVLTTLSKKEKTTLSNEWKASEKARLDAEIARPCSLAAKLVGKKGKKSSAANALLMLTALMGLLVDSSDDQPPAKGAR